VRRHANRPFDGNGFYCSCGAATDERWLGSVDFEDQHVVYGNRADRHPSRSRQLPTRLQSRGETARRDKQRSFHHYALKISGATVRSICASASAIRSRARFKVWRLFRQNANEQKVS
jgi:hypothetical protein